jgi:hypothetical protein
MYRTPGQPKVKLSLLRSISSKIDIWRGEYSPLWLGMDLLRT